MHNIQQQRIAVIGGGLAGLEFAVAAGEGGAAVEVFEAGPQTRTQHVNWDATAHAGDEKVRSWTSDGWGPGDGLSVRLGGRSLCYHGVLMGFEPAALTSWDPAWSARLAGDDGLYASVLDSLRADFPELDAGERYPQLAALGLRHVPQAARLDDIGRFKAYSPLARAIELNAAGRIQITRGRVRAVVPKLGGYVVEIEGSTRGARRRCFDTCVLASSAIGNVQILAASLRRDITTTVTDHFCVGAFVRLGPGASLAPFRHCMLWSGFVEVSEMGMNVFFFERPPLPCGDRIVQIQAVIEQQGGLSSYSELSVKMWPNGTRSHIRAKVSQGDHAVLNNARIEIRGWAERLAGGQVIEVMCNGPSTTSTARGRQCGSDASWGGHDEALEAVVTTDVTGVFCQYEVPYGAFEHEACTHPIGNGGPVPVSSALEVAELPGMYVVGPGAFPQLGVANPALTIIALSRWLGHRLSGRRATRTLPKSTSAGGHSKWP